MAEGWLEVRRGRTRRDATVGPAAGPDGWAVPVGRAERDALWRDRLEGLPSEARRALHEVLDAAGAGRA